MSWNHDDLEIAWTSLKRHLPESFQGIAVACSGGLDSTVLFHALRVLAERQKNFSLRLIHVAYGLRGDESDRDLAAVRALAQKYGYPLEIREVTDQERADRRGQGIQEWARDLRYRVFSSLAAQGWIIALAHHLDDAAETVLFRLARGASPGGLLGMREWTSPFWRPLLKVPKVDLLDYAVQHGISYREDGSNAKLDYARNVIRHRVLPVLESLFPGASGRIVACASDAQDLALPDELSASFSLAITPQIPDPRPMPLPNIPMHRSVPPGVARAAIAQIVAAGTGGVRQLSRAWLDSVCRQLDVGPRKGSSRIVACVPGGGRLWLDDAGQLTFRSECTPTTAQERRDQHRRALDGPDQGAILEPGAYAILRSGHDRFWALGPGPQPKVPRLYPVRYRVYGGAAVPTMNSSHGIETTKLKDLARRLEISALDRHRWRLLEVEGSALGLTDGQRVMRSEIKGGSVLEVSGSLPISNPVDQPTDKSEAVAEGEAHG